MSASHASISTAAIRFPLPLKIMAICGCVPFGVKQKFSEQNVYQRQMSVDLRIPFHPFLECCTSFFTILQLVTVTGQCLITGGVYNNPISPSSKFTLPQCALAFHEVLRAISLVFREMLL